MKIEKFDNVTLKVARKRIQEALDSAADDLGISIQLQRISYEDDRFSAKIEAGLVGTDGEVVTLEMKALKAYSKLHGIPDEYINGKAFMYSGRLVKLAGYRTRARKNNILFKQVSDGSMFVAPEDSIKAALARQGVNVGSFNRDKVVIK